MKDKITVIGSLNYDIILKISRLPYKGETLPANDAAYSAGGKGANQAVQAAKLHTPNIYGWMCRNRCSGRFSCKYSEAVWSKHRLYKKSSGKQRNGNYKRD